MNNCFGLAEYSPYYFGARRRASPKRRRAGPKRRRASPKRRRVGPKRRVNKKKKITKKQLLRKLQQIAKKNEISIYKLKKNGLPSKQKLSLKKLKARLTRMKVPYYVVSGKQMTQTQKLRKLQQIAKKYEINIYKLKKNGLPSKQKLSLKKLKARLTRMKVPYDKKMFR